MRARPRTGKKRPAVVVEDSDLFDPCYPNLVLVSLAEVRRPIRVTVGLG